MRPCRKAASSWGAGLASGRGGLIVGSDSMEHLLGNIVPFRWFGDPSGTRWEKQWQCQPRAVVARVKLAKACDCRRESGRTRCIGSGYIFCGYGYIDCMTKEDPYGAI